MKNNSKSKVKFSKEILLEAAEKQEQQDKMFVWLCRECGTWCLQERDVFLKDTREYNTLKFYREQTTEPMLAFIIEVMNAAATSVIGNVYALNYEEYSHHVVSTALSTKSILFQYEHGCRIRGLEVIIDGCPDIEYGEFQSIQHQPHSQEELTGVLRREKQERKCFIEGNQQEYLAKL